MREWRAGRYQVQDRMSTSNSSSTKRRWFRFSLRTLLIGTAVLGAILGLISNELIRVRRHREAVRTVRRLGGMYAYYCDGQCQPRGPWWLAIVCDDLYADEEVVCFCSKGNEGLRDEDLRVLTEFPRLRVVEICASGITDDGLVHLENVRGLRRLVLHETQVTGAGLRRLRKTPIEQLVLGQSAVSDETLECLDSFKRLKKLALYNTSVTDAGLQKLGRARDLEQLFLEKMAISDEGMRHVADLEGLKVLDLRDLLVGDEGIDKISRLARLESVELERLQITDRVFGRLARLPSLRQLSVESTTMTIQGLRDLQESGSLRFLTVGPNVSAESRQELKKLMPTCRVYDSSVSVRIHGP